MTNGDKFREIFSISQVDEGELYAFAWLPNHDAVEISIDWWNTEYKEPTTKNLCDSCGNSANCMMQSEIVRKECGLYNPTSKNDLGVDCIDRAELLKAMDTWDKFGYLANHGLIRLGKENKYYVQYVKYDDMVKCVNALPSVTPQEPRTHGNLQGCLECRYLDKLLTEREKQKYFAYLDGVADGLNESRNNVNSVLDKIKAEIVDLGQRTMNDNRASGIWACRDIIDKYKTESEEE